MDYWRVCVGGGVLHAGQRVDHVLDGGRGAGVAAEHGAKLFVLSDRKRERVRGGR
jgi:hypothetical protein